MSKSIKQIEQELLDLQKQKGQLEEKLIDAICAAFLTVAKRHPLQRISPHCFVVRFSEVLGNPLNPTFYDWEQSIKIIIKFLQPKPVEEWIRSLVIKLENSPQNQPVVFEYNRQFNGVRYSEKIPVSRLFVEEIVKELNK